MGLYLYKRASKIRVRAHKTMNGTLKVRKLLLDILLWQQ